MLDDVSDTYLKQLLDLLSGEIASSKSIEGFILDVWRSDPLACRNMLLDSAPHWKRFSHEIVPAVFLAANVLDDPAFLDLIDDCRQASEVPMEAKLRLLSLLVQQGREDALLRYVASFRRRLRAFRTGPKTDNLNSLALSAVLEVSRLRVDALLPELIELETMCERAVHRLQLTPLGLHAVHAAVVMFRDGPIGLNELIGNTRAHISQRGQAIYCLACLRRQEDISFFRELYWSRTDPTYFVMRSQIIDALGYFAPLSEFSTFLVDAIDETIQAGTLRARSPDRLLRELLEAAYYVGSQSDHLVARLNRVLDARNKTIAADALVVLERLNRVSSGTPTAIQQHVDSSRTLIRALVSGDRLVVHRTDA